MRLATHPDTVTRKDALFVPNGYDFQTKVEGSEHNAPPTASPVLELKPVVTLPRSDHAALHSCSQIMNLPLNSLLNARSTTYGFGRSPQNLNFGAGVRVN